MREIKFRGKRLDNDQWATGYFTRNDSNGVCYITDQGAQGCAHPQRVEPVTVGQFTGLHDKNGREIYEGDIVSWKLPGGETASYQVLFSDKLARFYITAIDPIPSTCIWFVDEMEVIGNIYENPELLGGKKP